MSVAAGAVIVVALYSLLETIIELLFKGAMWISETIMDSSVTIFNGTDNVLKTFVDLLPFENASGVNVINISSIMSGISYGIMALVILTAIIKSILAPVTGIESENGIQIGMRIVIAIILKNLIFGSGILEFNGLLGVLGLWFGKIMSSMSNGIDYENIMGFFNMKFSFNPVAYIGMLILMAALLGAVLGAAIAYIERIITLVISILVGPVAISLYASRDTEDIAKQWIISIFSQMMAVFLSLVLWVLFLNQIRLTLGNNDMTFVVDIGGGQAAVKIFRLAIAVAILSLARNAEKILNNFGLRTMPNLESARTLAGGIATLGSGMILAMRTAPIASRAINSAMHGPYPVQGEGKGSSVHSAFTGSKSIYDNTGALNSRGEGNRISNGIGTFISRSSGGGNSRTPINGGESVRSAFNRQIQAQEYLRNTVNNSNFKAGNAITGAVISDGKSLSGKDVRPKEYSGAETVNMAITGHSENHGTGFSFNGSTAMKQTEITNTNGVTIKGVSGAGIYRKPDGHTETKGTYFMPLEGGYENRFEPGTRVELGDEQQWFITGNSYQIDDNGAKAYEISTMNDYVNDGIMLSQESNELITRAISEAIESAAGTDYSNAGALNDFTVQFEQEFGTSNISNDVYDPSNNEEES